MGAICKAIGGIKLQVKSFHLDIEVRSFRMTLYYWIYVDGYHIKVGQICHIVYLFFLAICQTLGGSNLSALLYSVHGRYM